MPTILIVEDEKFLQQVVTTKFSERGWTTMTARSAIQAVEVLQHTPEIDAIWLDHYILGEQDGLGFVNHVRTHPTWSRIPIYVVSGNTDANDIRSYTELGIQDYYSKTQYSIEQIVDAVVDGHKPRVPDTALW